MGFQPFALLFLRQTDVRTDTQGTGRQEAQGGGRGGPGKSGTMVLRCSGFQGVTEKVGLLGAGYTSRGRAQTRAGDKMGLSLLSALKVIQREVDGHRTENLNLRILGPQHLSGAGQKGQCCPAL